MLKIPRVFEGWEVLVVDDERDSQEVARRLLSLAGARVLTTGDGQEALNLAQQHRSQLKFILSDLSMPEMDGWELLYHLKNEVSTAHIPVIALTAHAMTGDRERGIRAGFHNYVTKPLDPGKFIQQLVNLLGDVPEYETWLATMR